MTYVIAQPCVDVKDRACVDECPVDCIYEGERSLYIHPDECVDCGACEPVCPVEAIFYEDDLPTELVPHFFASLCESAGLNLHLAVRGENAHHMVEACFKAFARALRQAIRREGRELPSTKGAL